MREVTTKKRSGSLAVVLAAIGLAACDRDASDSRADEAARADAGSVVATAAEKNAEIGDTAAAKPVEAVTLEEGTHGAYGVKMPRGMIPIALPSKEVHRFEGTHDLTVVRRFVERQLELSQEPTTGLDGEVVFRHALALAAKGTADETRLSVRIFQGSLGGASVDIREETEVVATGERGVSIAAQGQGGYTQVPGWEKADAREAVSPAPRDRFERRRQVWEMMEKANRGERPTTQDLENPFFN